MAETPDQKRRGENLNRLTEQFAAKNNEAMMNLVKRVEEQTKKADDANRKRISDGELTAKELKDLKEKIIKFRQDELDHKDIAYEKGATKKGLYSIMDKVIKTGSKVAIKISEKI